MIGSCKPGFAPTILRVPAVTRCLMSWRLNRLVGPLNMNTSIRSAHTHVNYVLSPLLEPRGNITNGMESFSDLQITTTLLRKA